MKKALLPFIFLIYAHLTLFSQTHPLVSFNFTTQAQIDNFQTDHPGVTEVTGDVTISGDEILNLYGLEVITRISGDLWIDNNDSLTTLIGLHNLEYIGGSLHLAGLGGIHDFTGLEKVAAVGGKFEISFTKELVNAVGLNQLTSLGGDLDMLFNKKLVDLTGLAQLTTINGGILAHGNEQLQSLSGLEGITHVQGNLSLTYNQELESLNGLNQVNIIDGYLRIEDHGANLQNMAGLEQLTEVGSYILIDGNPGMIDLVGLDNLVQANGLHVENNLEIRSLEGLNQLTTLGGSLYLENNNRLKNLDPLLNLTSITGNIILNWNDSLTSLFGLQHVESGTITDLYFDNNRMLSNCEIDCVCDFLANPAGTIYISGNATGCSTTDEVEQLCLVKVPENKLINSIAVLPNPFEDELSIVLPDIDVIEVEIQLIDILGKKMLSQQIPIDNHVLVIKDIPTYLHSGIYFLKLEYNGMEKTIKVVKR
jgi:hypothetical protein